MCACICNSNVYFPAKFWLLWFKTCSSFGMDCLFNPLLYCKDYYYLLNNKWIFKINKTNILNENKHSGKETATPLLTKPHQWQKQIHRCRLINMYVFEKIIYSFYNALHWGNLKKVEFSSIILFILLAVVFLFMKTTKRKTKINKIWNIIAAAVIFSSHCCVVMQIM